MSQCHTSHISNYNEFYQDFSKYSEGICSNSAYQANSIQKPNDIELFYFPIGSETFHFMFENVDPTKI